MRGPRAPKHCDFLGACLRIAGVLSLAAGVVFFVAANWSEIAVFGRFALLELLLLACVVARLREAAAATSSAAARSSSHSSPPARCSRSSARPIRPARTSTSCS